MVPTDLQRWVRSNFRPSSAGCGAFDCVANSKWYATLLMLTQRLQFLVRLLTSDGDRGIGFTQHDDENGWATMALVHNESPNGLGRSLSEFGKDAPQVQENDGHDGHNASP